MQENNQDLTQEKMQDEIKSAIERMQEEMREKENLIATLKSIDLNEPITEKKWHEICRTQLRRSKIMEYLAAHIFPNATDFRVNANGVKMDLYGFKCDISTTYAESIDVDMTWRYIAYEPKEEYKHSRETWNMYNYFKALDAAASWKTLFDLRFPQKKCYPTYEKWILWNTRYKHEKIDRKMWDTRFKEDNARYKNARKNYERQMQEIKEKEKIFHEKLLPTLHTFTKNVNGISGFDTEKY